MADGLYLTWLVDVLRGAGLTVRENADTNGWQTRARSSGGFPSTPLGVQWHHTASRTAPENDVHWQVHGTDAPIGNLLLDRAGCYWPIAAGAANTAGKGGPLTLSRGTIPKDSANTRSVAIEAANDGVGERWPCVQVDAYFAGSNAINARLGNLPGDVFTHALGAGDGWTDRKIDPAGPVEGPWQPRQVNTSGTWALDDIRAECARRASETEGDDVQPLVIKGDASDTYWAWDGVNIAGIPGLEWVQWGYDAGIYRGLEPVEYPQDFVDLLVEAQGS